MALTNPCTHGATNETMDHLTVRGVFTANAIIGKGVNSGTFSPSAAGGTTVSEANCTATSQVILTATNAGAGLLMRTKTWWVDTISDGSFKFNVSATGAGAPAGTETIAYVIQNETDVDS